MKIERPDLISELARFARDGSGVIVGPPGIGKSYTLGQLRDNLKRDKIPHLILPVERLGDASPAALLAVLKREGDFVELLRAAAAKATAPAILIFDGFDAARGESERAGVLRLILRAVTELRGQWNTIVSIRTFDAKKSRKLLELFPNEQMDGVISAGSCREFFIPPLNANELEQVFPQVPGLREIYSGGTNEFKSLLTIPFNLWLIERVLKAGANANEFSQVTSEVQLLEMYWNHRVRNAPHAEDREFILTNITRTMVESHTLSARREKVYDPKINVAWMELLSDEILVEQVERDARIGFTHNILFDFAVSAHLLDSDPIKLARFIAEEPARPLFLRPSLVYHFTRLWHFERETFWLVFWGVIRQQEIHLRQIIRLVLPAVVVNEAQKIDDLAPLLESLVKKDAMSTEAVAILLQALRVLKSPKQALWAEFVRIIGNHLHEQFAWDAGVLASAAVEAKGLTDKVTADYGEFGRALLQWAWNSRADTDKRRWFERLAGTIAIPLVARTYATNKQEASKLVEMVLQVVGEPDFPVDCIYRLSNEVEYIIPSDPDVVAKIYRKIFGFEETSQERTQMGGQVMPMTSTRSQDYGMCRYCLIQSFPLFLATHTLQAIRAGIQAVEAFVIQDHVLRYLKGSRTIQDSTVQLSFRDRKTTYIEDGSAIWDASSYPDRELAIAENIFTWFSNAAKEGQRENIERFLEVFAVEAHVAFLWARLLAVGAKHPSQLAPYLWELTKSTPLVIENDTLHSLGAFLERAVEFFSEPQRREVEQFILHLPEAAPDGSKQLFEGRRNRLLARIPAALLATPEAIELRKTLEAESKLTPNRPLFQFTSSFKPFGEEEFLREQGANLESPANQEIRELYQPLRKWSEKKDDSQIDPLLPTAIALKDLLNGKSSADEPVLRAAWTYLAGFASDAVNCTKTIETGRLQLLREILLQAAANPDPRPNAEYDENWDHASWSPAPRNDAATALPLLAHLAPNQEFFDVILRLADDPVPSVRFLLSCELWRLVECRPDLMWSILDRSAQNESNKVVLQGVTISLWQLIPRDKPRSMTLIDKLLARIDEQDDDSEEKARGSLVWMVVDYAVCDDNQWAKQTLRRWQENALQFPASISISGQRLIAYIEPKQPQVLLERARSLLFVHLNMAAKGLTTLQKKDANIPQEEIQKKWKQLYGVIDETVMRFYFALDIDSNLRQRKENPLDDKTRKQFFSDILPILEKIIGFGNQPETGMLLAPTAHHFMELLRGILSYDPALTLRLAADVVRSSKRFSYNLDSLAMTEVVKLVETILADYRDQVQEEASIKNLLELLDAFVEAGWPQALNLVWRLDEIYR